MTAASGAKSGPGAPKAAQGAAPKAGPMAAQKTGLTAAPKAAPEAAAATPRFSRRSLALLKGLGAATERSWYHDRKDEIEALLLAPARRLVAEVGARLAAAASGLVVDPRVDRGIYRLYRDTRFAGDKRPYKGHLGLIWWEDRPEGKLESPSFYLQLEPGGWLAATGIYRFSPPVLAAWRREMSDGAKAARFQALADRLEAAGNVFGEPELKRVPSNLSAPEGSPAAWWLRYKGLGVWAGGLDAAELFGDGAAGRAAERLLGQADLFRYLAGLRPSAPAAAAGPRPAAGAGGRPGRHQFDF